jgi:hypothetical protein
MIRPPFITNFTRCSSVSNCHSAAARKLPMVILYFSDVVCLQFSV